MTGATVAADGVNDGVKDGERRRGGAGAKDGEREGVKDGERALKAGTGATAEAGAAG